MSAISPEKRVFISRNPAQTWDLAGRIVKRLPESAVLALHGRLGSGKTCFVQGVAAALRIECPVTSPSFTLVNEYLTGVRPLYHIDLYRVMNPDEIFSLDLEDYLYADGITAVEWAERAGDLIPPAALHILFESWKGREERRITLWTGNKSPVPAVPDE